MATKPSITYTFATNALFTVGPFIGSATKIIPGDLLNGFVPGNGVPAAWFNYVINVDGDWITNWLDLGSSAADLDAHIVETDASGFASIASTTLGGTAAAQFAVVATENSGAASTTASFTNSSAGIGVLASTGSGASAAVRAVQTGAFSAVQGVNVGGGGAGGAFNGNGAGAGVLAEGGSTGNGVTADSGSSAGHGLVATSHSFAGDGVQGLSRSAGDGPSGGSRGVRGTAQQNDTFGVHGGNASAGGSANATSGGVYGFGSSTNGVVAQSTDAYGLWAQSDTTTPISAPVHMVPQDDDPSSGSEGDVTYNGTTDELRGYVNSRWQTAWTTQDGFTRGLVGPSSAANNDQTTYTTLSTCSLPAPYDPKHTGNVMIHAAAEFGATAGSVHTTIDVRLYDATAAATIWSRTIEHPGAVAGPIYDRPWSIVIPYALPGTGSRTIELQFKKPAASATGVSARDAGVFVLGVF